MASLWHTGINFTKTVWAHDPSFAQIHFAFTWMIIIRSGHNFVYAMTAQLSWHMQNCDLIGSLESKLEQNKFAQDFSYELINSLWNGPLVAYQIVISKKALTQALFHVHDPGAVLSVKMASYWYKKSHWRDKENNVRLAVNYHVTSDDSPMIFMSDAVTSENH